MQKMPKSALLLFYQYNLYIYFSFQDDLPIIQILCGVYNDNAYFYMCTYAVCHIHKKKGALLLALPILLRPTNVFETAFIRQWERA